MRWHHLGPDFGVLEIAYTLADSPTAPVAKGERQLDLAVFWGGGVPTRAVWRWSGRVAGWAAVGEA